jgi:hypothetical protein
MQPCLLRPEAMRTVSGPPEKLEAGALAQEGEEPRAFQY